MKDRIRSLLIDGLRASEIVTIVGCTPGYISQLVKDEEFKKSVEVGMIEAAAVKTEEDHLETRYQNLEHKLVSGMEDAMVGAELPAITAALSILHKRADMRYARRNPTTVGPTTHVNIVSLQLPAHALAAPTGVVTLNTNNEIIAIEGRALAPMSASGVKALFAQRLAEKDKQAVEVLESI